MVGVVVMRVRRLWGLGDGVDGDCGGCGYESETVVRTRWWW